jgi:sugar/nucleoside kinase (ribokinase family)
MRYSIWCHNVSVFLRLAPKRYFVFLIMRGLMVPVAPRSKRKLVVLGEFFLDFIFYNLPEIPRMGEEVKTASFGIFPGGGLATTALVAAGLGTPTQVITRVGLDAQSSQAWARLGQAGVHTKCCEFDSHLPTAMTVCAAFGFERMMITHDVINKNLVGLLSRGTVQKELLSATHLHLACSLLPSQKWSAAIRKLVRSGMSISVDVGWNLETLQSPRLPALLQGLQFTFPNEVEAKAMTGARHVESAAKKLANWVRVPVIKLGPDGSLAVWKGNLLKAKPLRVRTVDATGSGDAFNGGFLHACLAGWPIEDCLRAGNVCGALAASQAGGSSSIPTEKSLKQWMNKIR